MKKLLLITLFFCNFLNADVAGGVLKKYKSNIFICTGAGNCIDITRALHANFAYVHGIEKDKILVNHSRFAIPAYLQNTNRKFNNYTIYHGDSRQLLPITLNSIKEAATILLNSYLPEIDHPEKENHVLEELEKIKNHHIKRHIILIDYIHLADSKYFGNVSLKSVKKQLLAINPNYKFKFEKGGHLGKEEKAVLVAIP